LFTPCAVMLANNSGPQYLPLSSSTMMREPRREN
jgi:hypothetical protein